MADLASKVRARLRSTDWDAWNHPVRAKLLTPVLVLVGGAVSILVQIELDHQGYRVWPDGVLTVGGCLGMLLAGYIVLAVID